MKKAKEAGYFIKCFYVLTADPIINVARVKLRALTGGHDVPEDKIVSRYNKALALIPELIAVCDICHIYDNSGTQPFRIFKKRKDEFFYDDMLSYWQLSDIELLTGISSGKSMDLNK